MLRSLEHAVLLLNDLSLLLALHVLQHLVLLVLLLLVRLFLLQSPFRVHLTLFLDHLQLLAVCITRGQLFGSVSHRLLFVVVLLGVLRFFCFFIGLFLFCLRLSFIHGL